MEHRPRNNAKQTKPANATTTTRRPAGSSQQGSTRGGCELRLGSFRAPEPWQDVDAAARLAVGGGGVLAPSDFGVRSRRGPSG